MPCLLNMYTWVQSILLHGKNNCCKLTDFLLSFLFIYGHFPHRETHAEDWASAAGLHVLELHVAENESGRSAVQVRLCSERFDKSPRWMLTESRCFRNNTGTFLILTLVLLVCGFKANCYIKGKFHHKIRFKFVFVLFSNLIRMKNRWHEWGVNF